MTVQTSPRSSLQQAVESAGTVPRSGGQDMLAGHRELRRRIAQVMHVWSEVDQLGVGPNFQQMTETVLKLQQVLASHFAEEEVDGYLAPALKQAPRFTTEAAKLQAEHATFLARLDGFVERLQDSGQPFEHWDDVRSELEAFLADLRHHEAAETRILQLAFNVDIGSKD